MAKHAEIEPRWSREQPRGRQRPLRHSDVAMSGDGRWVAVSTGPEIWLSHKDQRVRIFDAATGALAFEDVHGAFDEAFPRTLVFRGPDELVFGLRVVARVGAGWARVADRAAPVRDGDYDARGARYLVGGPLAGERKVKICDAATGAVIQSWTLPSPGPFQSTSARIASSGDRAIAWSKRGLWWCVVGRRQPEQITDTIENAPVWGPDGDAVLVLAHAGGPATLYRADGSSAAWTCHGRSLGRVLIGPWLVHQDEHAGEIRALDAATGRLAARLVGLPDVTLRIAAYSQARVVVAATPAGHTAVWDLSAPD